MSRRYSLQIDKGSPTVVPKKLFLSGEDATTLRKAMKGIGTNEKSIINVIAKRSFTQRSQIITDYKNLFNKDIIEELKSELSGNFRKLILALMTPLPLFYAEELHNAIQGLGTDENVLIEVLCTLKNSEITAIKHAYLSKYKKSLEADLKGDTSGSFKTLLITLCASRRNESNMTDLEHAKADAQSLYNAGENRWGTDQSTFNRILVFENYAQLKLIFNEYERLAGHSFEEAIKNEFSGDIKNGHLAIVDCVRNKAAFYAKQINKAIKGLGTSDSDLIRLVVTRCEVDMGDIKREYENLFGESLTEAIKGDCSGDYEKCLLTLIGEM